MGSGVIAEFDLRPCICFSLAESTGRRGTTKAMAALGKHTKLSLLGPGRPAPLSALSGHSRGLGHEVGGTSGS